MKTHLITSCSETKLKCNKCNLVRKRKEINSDHLYCEIEKLKMIQEAQATEIEKLKTSNIYQKREIA